MIQNTGRLITSVAIKQFSQQQMVEGKNFKVKLHKQGALKETKVHKLAPGMSVTLDVVCNFETGDDVAESVVKILTVEDNNILEVPLKATPPAPVVSVDGDVEFGRIVGDGRMHHQSLRLNNTGKKATTWKVIRLSDTNEQYRQQLVANNPSLRKWASEIDSGIPLDIMPTEGLLSAVDRGGDQAEVVFGISSASPLNKPTAVNFVVEVDGVPSPIPFQVKCNLVGHAVKLVGNTDTNAASPLTSLDLGCVYYGTGRITTATLVNDGPTDVIFSLAAVGHDRWVEIPGGARMPEFSADTDGNLQDLAVTVGPSGGVIGPRQRLTVQFFFNPVAASPESGWSKDYEAPPRRDYKFYMRACAVGTDMTSDFELTGSACAPAFTLSTTSLDFPALAVGGSAEESFHLRNDSVQLPLSYEADPIAHYIIKPEKAVILPGEKLDVSVTFSPKQASPLDRPLPLHFAERTVSVPVNLSGTCSADASGLTKSRIHRLATIKTQLESKTAFRFGFTPLTSQKAQYISGPDGRQRHGIHATANPNAKLKSIRPTGKPYIGQDPAYTIDLAATTKKGTERLKYSNYVTELGTKRREVVVNRRRNNPKKIEFNGGVGAPPEPLPPRVRKLDAEAERRAKIQGYADAAAAEGAMSKMLSPTDLSRIGPRVHRIDFGDVCEGSTNVVALALKNGIDTPVSMQLRPHGPELADTAQHVFIIPARAIQEIDVVLTGIDGSTARNYNMNIDYIVNGHHVATIVTIARVVPPNLDLSVDTIPVQVQSAAKCDSFVSSLTLRNTLGHAASFTWELKDAKDNGLTAEHYSITPADGRVDEHGTLDVVVQLNPTFHMPKGATFILNVAGTKVKKELKVLGKHSVPSCRMDGSLLLFDKVAINAPSVLEATVVNTGSEDAYFKISDMKYRPKALYGLDIRPLEGSIRAGERVRLQVSYVPTSLCKFEADFKVLIRGGQPLKVHCSGTGTNPDLKIDVDSFFFGRAPCSTVAKQQLMLTNNGNSRLCVSFDLRDQRDFSIAHPENFVYGIPRRRADPFDSDLLYADEHKDPAVVQQAWKKALMADFLVQTKLPAARKAEFSAEIADADEMLGTLRLTAGRDDTVVTRKGQAFRIDVEPHESVPVLLEFAPTEVAAYDFHLPIAVNGLPFGSKRVRGTASRTNVVLSATSFDYGCLFLSAGLEDDDNAPPVSVTKQVSVQWVGPAVETLVLEQSTSSSAAGGFSCMVAGTPYFVSDGTAAMIDFQPNETKELLITFAPPGTEFFESRLQFRTAGENGIDAGEIYLRGFATRPFLASNKLFVEIPPAPVGVSSSTSFEITASGLKDGQSFDLDFKLPAAAASCPVELSFPKGTTMVGGKLETLPVDAVFTSAVPISFDAAIDFEDPVGGTCSVRVTGKADNSMLTIYPYVANHPDVYHVSTAPELTEAEYLTQMMSIATRWMSTFGIARQVPFDLPESLTNNCGRLTFDLIKHLSGKEVPGLTLVRPDTMTPGQMLHAFGLMLKFLTTEGAVLSDVRPMMLLPKPYFVTWKKEQARNMLEAGLLHLNQGKQWTAYYDAMEANFNDRTCRAWTTVLTQVLRVFTLGHVTEKKVRARCNDNLPEIEPLKLEVHCEQEELLLKWLTYLHQSVSGAEHAVSNFGDDLADGRVLASVLVAHVPPLADTFFSDLFVVAETESQRRHNACRVVAAVKAIGLDEFVLDWQDITSPNPVWMTLLAAFLFESLAQYTLPEETIVFSSLLHQKVTRKIKIANPTNQSLTYRVRIDGTDQFSSKATITVPKRSEKALDVVCLPRFYQPAQAVLLLTGAPTGAARGSVLIFRIESQVFASKSSPSVTFTQPCYSLRKIAVPVTNKFAQGGKFKLSSSSVTADDASDFASTVEGGTAAEKRKAQLTRVNTRRPGYRDNKRDFLWADEEEVYLQAGETKKIICNICPTRMGHHRASLILTHPELGQIESIAAGLVSEPKQISTLAWSCDVGDEQGRTMSLPYVNPLKLKAIQAIPGAMDDPVLTKTLTLAASSGKLLSEDVVLNVALISDVIESALRVPLEVPKKVTLSPGQPAKDGKLLATHVSTASLVKYKETTEMPVRLNPLRIGEYECKVLFTGNDDIRVYRFLIEVKDPRGKDQAKAPLRRVVNCMATKEMVETFEVHNGGKVATVFKVMVDLPKGVAGTVGGTTVSVAAGESIDYDVMFCPPKAGEVHGSLAFLSDTSHMEYQLMVNIEAPPEGELVPIPAGVVELASRTDEAAQMSVTIDNPLEVPVTYTCAIAGGNEGELIGEPTLTIAAESTSAYAVTFQPDVVGSSAATLVLRGSTSDGRAIGAYSYAIQAVATAAPAQSEQTHPSKK
jgi:hypothetical protein